MDNDYTHKIEKFATPLAKTLLDKMYELKEDIIYPEVFESDEERQEHDQKMAEIGADLAIFMMKEATKSGIPADFISVPMDKLMAVLVPLKTHIDGLVKQTRDEIMSRYIGVRDEKTNLYQHHEASMGDLMLKLEEIRQETGNDPNDFFGKGNVGEEAIADSKKK